LREGLPPRDLTNQPSPALMKRVTRDDAYAQAVRDFMDG
jgi:hypothetical protein